MSNFTKKLKETKDRGISKFLQSFTGFKKKTKNWTIEFTGFKFIPRKKRGE